MPRPKAIKKMVVAAASAPKKVKVDFHPPERSRKELAAWGAMKAPRA